MGDVAFLSVVYHLQLSPQHELVAIYMHAKHGATCIPLMTAELYQSAEHMQVIITDFLRFNLCVLEKDPNFIRINDRFIYSMLAKLQHSSEVCRVLTQKQQPDGSTKKRALPNPKNEEFADTLRKKNEKNRRANEKIYYNTADRN